MNLLHMKSKVPRMRSASGGVGVHNVYGPKTNLNRTLAIDYLSNIRGVTSRPIYRAMKFHVISNANMRYVHVILVHACIISVVLAQSASSAHLTSRLKHIMR